VSGTIRHLRPTAGITVRAADDAFLDQVRSPNTRRASAIAVVKTADRLVARDPDTALRDLGRGRRRMAGVAEDEIGDALEFL
jgi:hypothetical protein